MKTTSLIRFVILHLILFTLLRLAFYWAFKAQDETASALVWKSFRLGLRFDLRFALLLLLPLLIFGWKKWSPAHSKLSRRIWAGVYTLIGAAWLAFYIFDFGFYAYLDTRINSSALVFMENPEIALPMVWQSYPVVWIVLAFLAFMGFYYFLLRRFVFNVFAKNFLGVPSLLLNVVFGFFFLAGLYGHVSQYPLRWSEAFFSPKPFLSHMALNPVLYFFETYEFSSKVDYSREKVKGTYDVMADYLGVAPEDKNPDMLNFKRRVLGSDNKSKPNVVVIIMESMAMSKTDLAGNPLKPTPALLKLAQKGYWFNNYYSPCEGTARNIFGIMTATPDVTKVQTSTRNPLVVDQKLIINAYKNYKKFYLLGGSASWANIRGIFSHNVDDIEIIEEGAFKSGRTDVWGVSDLDLFIEAHERFAKVPPNQPFFAVIQSASFHRPYTIPATAKNFKLKNPSPVELKEAGFYSDDQFNSLRFSDYSLGEFFKRAEKSPYYKNTIFVITGDHGLPDEGGVNVKPGPHHWLLEKYHVPLIFVNEKLFAEKGAMDPRPAGHSDLMTSTAFLAGVDHDNTTLGRNLFDAKYDKERYSFIYNYYSEISEYGLINGEYYYRHDDLSKGQLYLYRSDDPLTDVKDQHPEVFQRMDLLGGAYLETAKFLLFNNQKVR